MISSVNSIQTVNELYGINKVAKDVRIGDFVNTYNKKAVDSKEFANLLVNRGLRGDVDEAFINKAMPGIFAKDGKFTKKTLDTISTWRRLAGLKAKSTIADLLKSVTESAKQL